MNEIVVLTSPTEIVIESPRRQVVLQGISPSAEIEALRAEVASLRAEVEALR